MIYFKLSVCFYVAFLFSRYFWISRKTNISFKASPNPKSPNDPWWLCNLSLIWWEMTCKNWFMTYQWLELWWNNCLHENYAPLRGFPLPEWIGCFLLYSLETKCELMLISFGSVNFLFVLSFLIVAFWKKMLFW